MAYEETVAERVRAALAAAGAPEVAERKMFGGLALMVNGHMCVGVLGEELMLRVGPEAYGDALAQPHSREMDSPASRSRASSTWRPRDSLRTKIWRPGSIAVSTSPCRCRRSSAGVPPPLHRSSSRSRA